MLARRKTRSIETLTFIIIYISVQYLLTPKTQQQQKTQTSHLISQIQKLQKYFYFMFESKHQSNHLPLLQKSTPVHPSQQSSSSTSLQNKTNQPHLNNSVKLIEINDQFFRKQFEKIQNSNSSLLKMFEEFSSQDKGKLEKYCIQHFDNLPLFLIYELSLNLPLNQLHSICTSELISQNYQQLNYYKFDLVKCSFKTFKQILQQYNLHVKSLEIQGLKPSDLKSIIDDYCLMCNIKKQEKQLLYAQYVHVKNKLLIPQGQGEVRRSMMEPKTNKIMELSTPINGKILKQGSLVNKSPTLGEIGLGNVGNSEGQGSRKDDASSLAKTFTISTLPPNMTKSKTFSNQSSGSVPIALTESANLIRQQIQFYKSKQTQMFEDIKNIKKLLNNNNNHKFMKDKFDRLQKIIQNMKNQINCQNQKIIGLQKSASDIKASTTSSKKIDFVFSF